MKKFRFNENDIRICPLCRGVESFVEKDSPAILSLDRTYITNLGETFNTVECDCDNPIIQEYQLKMLCNDPVRIGYVKDGIDLEGNPVKIDSLYSKEYTLGYAQALSNDSLLGDPKKYTSIEYHRGYQDGKKWMQEIFPAWQNERII